MCIHISKPAQKQNKKLHKAKNCLSFLNIIGFNKPCTDIIIVLWPEVKRLVPQDWKITAAPNVLIKSAQR